MKRTRRKRDPDHKTFGQRAAEFLDRVVFAFSPERGARRMATRQMWAATEKRNKLQMRYYEGAESDRLRGDKWLGSQLSPDSELESDLDTLRDRSRELYKNDTIGGAVDTRTNNVVGTGFKPQSRILASNGITEETAKQWDRQLEAIYRRWSKRVDPSGRWSLWAQQRLAERHWAVDGESITILSDVGISDKPVPLCVEVIDPKRCETPPKEAGNPRVRLGIKYDANGRIVSYFIRKKHPDDTVDTSEEFDEIPADRVLHLYERWFAGQSRGLPWLTRALNRAKDAKDLDEAEIIASQVAACYAVFIKSPMGAHRAAVGAGNETTSTGQRQQEVEPGMFHYLNDGEDVDFGDPKRPGATYAPFQEWNYRRIAAGINFPFEMLVKNWTGLSFAAGRLSLAEARLDFRCRQQFHRELWLERIWERMVAEAVIIGAIDIDARDFDRRPWVYTNHEWIAPKFPYVITPKEEIQADIMAVENDLKTKADVIGEGGGDYDTVMETRKRERERERERDDGTEPVRPGAANNKTATNQQTKQPAAA